MLTFRSEVFPDFFSEKFGYSHKTMFIGSCFTENIGKKLLELKFPTLISPFGILYNPVSVSNCLKYCISPLPFKKNDLFYFNEKWISFSHHGRFSGLNADEVLKDINNEMFFANRFIKETSVLYITFGTSWVYKHKKTNQIVANCHKLPSSDFEHYSLSIDNIVEIYCSLLDEIHKINSELKIVFTVSPVRHWKDGPVNNQLSKSILIVSIQELVKNFDFVSYFPSYEIMMDDLRDYRFYADDLFHPNQMGIDYIWDKFKECFIKTDSLELSGKVDQIVKAMAHKPFYPCTQAYQKFIENNLLSIKHLTIKFPNLDLSDEKDYFLAEKMKYFE
jgi:hypothetical protein